VAKEAAKVEETPKEVEAAVVEEELAKEVAQETLEDGLVPPAILAMEVVPTTLLPSKVDSIQVPSPGLTDGTLTSFLSVCLFHIQII